MEQTIVQLIDLPDELLVLIFMKLCNVELLYSLMGINIRLDRILSDPIFTGNLTLLRHLSNDRIYPLVDTVVDRFYLQILPQIHCKINTLTLESLSMERILLAADYPNLHSLELYNVDEKTSERVFSDESLLFDMFNKKIQSLIITIRQNEKKVPNERLATLMFTNILTVFSNLRYLNYYPFLQPNFQSLLFHDKSPTFFSSVLMELHIQVVNFDDCLYLLDGRLNQLRMLFVDIEFICLRNSIILKKEQLPNIRFFSLTSKWQTPFYDELIVPLLHRMSSLEKLALYIAVEETSFLDGNNLKKDIINHFPRLNIFAVNVRSFVVLPDLTHLVSCDEIQHSLTGLGVNQAMCYVDYFSKERSAQCHFYSYPYTLRYYENITNSFRGGLFKCVRRVSLFDDRPFEHEFFIRIAQSFPLMEELCVINLTGQQQQQANDNNEHLSIVEYLHLNELNLSDVDDDYVEQFLINTKTHLLNNVRLCVTYQSLKRVTQNFTRDATRVNCAKVCVLRVCGKFEISERLSNYFCHAKILRFL